MKRHLQVRDSSNNRREQKKIGKTREQVAKLWLQLPDRLLASSYLGKAGQIHKAVISRLLVERPGSKKERQQAGRLLQGLPDSIRETGAIGRLLAAMLYNRAHELPPYFELEAFPKWLVHDYLRYMTNPALLFCVPNESERCFEHMRRWVDYLHRSIMENPASVFWRDVAKQFAQVSDFGPLYFNDQNVMPLYAQRGDIIEHVLRSGGYAVDNKFASLTERQPLRIGVLSVHCDPSPETYAMLPVFEFLGSGFDATIYVLRSSGEPLEQYCKTRVESLKVLPNNLKSQVEYIRKDKLDVLFVATNITASCNPICYLAAHRLARVQVAGTGSVTTTGLRNIDYYMTGTLTDKKSSVNHYRETLMWLDGPAHCFSYGPDSRHESEPISRTELGIADDVTVYASGANIFKVLPELMILWARLLGSHSGSALMLYPYGPNWSSSYPKDLFAQRLSEYFTAEGVAVNRLFILDPDPVPDRNQIREYLKIADVYLDSFPFSATTSLIEPLELGLPIVSRGGKSFRSSMGAALLEEIGMHELIASDADEYIALAGKIGRDAVLRQALGGKIHRAMKLQPAFLDSVAYSRRVGKLFRGVSRKGAV